MSNETQYNYNEYFQNRNVDHSYYEKYKIPKYLMDVIPSNKDAAILDIGCGFGQFLAELKQLGYTNIRGIDLSSEAVSFCKSQGLNVVQVDSLGDFAKSNSERFELVVMSHVLEHIEKGLVIETLKVIKSQILSTTGKYCVMVPNGQSNTGAYWMYEDFTHYNLYTAGSLYYVLKSAGFNHVTFLDPKGTANIKPYKRWIIHFLQWLYMRNQDFWNIVTGSSFHKASPRIYTFEIKALAQ